jgi:IS1 family transposase
MQHGRSTVLRSTGREGAPHASKRRCFVKHSNLITRRKSHQALMLWRTRLSCADDYAVYDVLVPVGQLYSGKDETHGIERDNARQQHGLTRFRRRSIVVSKAKRLEG